MVSVYTCMWFYPYINNNHVYKCVYLFTMQLKASVYKWVEQITYINIRGRVEGICIYTWTKGHAGIINVYRWESMFLLKVNVYQFYCLPIIIRHKYQIWLFYIIGFQPQVAFHDIPEGSLTTGPGWFQGQLRNRPEKHLLFLKDDAIYASVVRFLFP